MSCAACQTRVEKAVSAVEGVTSCSVSLLTNTMGVEGNASPEDIIDAVVKAGYGASVQGISENKQNDKYEYMLKDRETPVLKSRLKASVILLLVLMYVSMGHGMLGWYLLDAVTNAAAIGTIEMLLAIFVMFINKKFFVFISLRNAFPI